MNIYKIYKKISLVILTSILALIGFAWVPDSAKAQTPSFTREIYGGKITPNGAVEEWNKNTNLSAGDSVKFLVQVRNDVAGSLAENVNIKINFPSGEFTTAETQLTVSSPSATDVGRSTQVNINGGGSLSYQSGSMHLKWNDGSTQWDQFIPDGDSVVTSNGYTLPAGLLGGNPYTAEIKITATVVGSGNTNNNSNNNNSSSPPASPSNQPPSCSASKPQAPTLNKASRTSGTSVNLEWSKVDNASSYHVVYGTSSGNYTYAANVGNTTSTTIAALAPGQTYYFAVKAINDCVPSSLSNEKLATFGTILSSSHSTENGPENPDDNSTVLGEETSKGNEESQLNNQLPEPNIKQLQQKTELNSKTWVSIFVAIVFVSLAFVLYLWFSRRFVR